MKRIFTIMLVALSMQLFAQMNVPTPRDPKVDMWRTDRPVRNHQPALNKTNVAKSGWFNYLDGLKNSGLGSIGSGYAPNIQPDSNLLVVYKDATSGTYKSFNVDMHAIGMAMDPKSQVWDAASSTSDYFRMNRYTAYTMDSLAFSYIYNRYRTDNDDDTLIIQFYTSPAASGISKSYLINADSPNVATMTFDQSTSVGKNSVRTVKYLLNWKDTAVNFKTFLMGVAPALNVSAGQIVGATVLFKSARATTLGDTLTSDDALLPTVKNKYNQFRMYLGTDNAKFLESDSKKSNPTPVVDRIWQNTEIMISEVKYGLFASWAGTYWPGDLYVSVHYQVDMDFHLNATNVGIAPRINNLKSIDVYPNPSNGASEVTFEYQLSNTSNVAIEVIDLLGKKISSVNAGTQEAGTHTTAINVSALPNGIYFANINVNGVSQTVKFTVTK